MSELLDCKIVVCPKCKKKIVLKHTETLYANTLLLYDSNVWGIVKYEKYEGNCCGKIIKREKEIISTYNK